MPRISIGDCHLFYERHGAGFPAVLVSGLAGTAQYWHDQVPSLSRAYEVIVHDHRGIGESDAARYTPTVERMAHDVIALMNALDVRKAHIIGHSAGGAVAQILAVEHPQRCASIVVAASWMKPDPYLRRLFTLRKEILTRLGVASYVQTNTLLTYPASYIARNNEKLRQVEAFTLAHSPPVEHLISRIDAILAFDRSADLGRIRTPTLLMAAEDDLVTPAYFTEELARHIPGAEAKFFPQGGHYFSQVNPREFIQALLPFLAAHTPAEAGVS